MKETVKNILKRLNIYHPLQSFYRDLVFIYLSNKFRRSFKKYIGKGFTCNVCQSSYDKFVPDYPSCRNIQAININAVIAGYGENVFCPNCLSTARERLVIAILSEMDLAKKNILHLSPEKNIYHFIKEKATVTTADLLPGFYKTIDGLVQKQDATQLDFADDSFDLIIANHILEHIPDDKKAMQELCRVLKPAGTAIMQVPYSEKIAATIEEPGINDPIRQSLLFGQKDHVRIYLLSNYIIRLQQAGFDAAVVPYASLEKYYGHAIQLNECFIKISKPVNA